MASKGLFTLTHSSLSIRMIKRHWSSLWEMEREDLRIYQGSRVRFHYKRPEMHSFGQHTHSRSIRAERVCVCETEVKLRSAALLRNKTKSQHGSVRSSDTSMRCMCPHTHTQDQPDVDTWQFYTHL